MKARSIIAAFTLVELLVSMSVLALLVILVAQLMNSATTTTTQGNKHMEADAQARSVYDRIAVDFAQMVKRPDVDYYLKSSANAQAGNDQIAFYSQVPGYYPSTGAKSPLSLVAYRVNSDTSSQDRNRLQRLGYGLLWSGVSPTDTPIVFLPLTIASTWPMATNMAADTNYEVAGPQVFRMEYYYLLKGAASNPAILSETPWDTRAPTNHTAVTGMQDVAAVGVAIAIIDPKSKVLVSDANLQSLAGAMKDFPAGSSSKPGELEDLWQAAVDASTVPRPIVSAIRIYQRQFFLPPAPSVAP
jgi:type II secretory pathway pseudopilin PulG